MDIISDYAKGEFPMVKVIMGLKGSGKTKNLIESINETAKKDQGSVVCIEKGNALKYDVTYLCRLIDAGEYQLYGYTFLKGFICGLPAISISPTFSSILSTRSLLNPPWKRRMSSSLGVMNSARPTI